MPLPRIDPVRPLLAREVPRGREWVYELKLDGFRGVLYVENGSGRFLSKTSRPLKRFQELADSLAAALPVENAILDGEVIVMGEAGPDFYALMFNRGRAQYAAFDLLWLNGRDLRPLPYWRRRRALALAVRGTPIGLVESVADPALFDVAAQMDLEGVVAKRRSDAYGAGTPWIKVKHRGYSQMQGRWELFAARR